LSGYHGDSVVGGGVEGEETDHSPLYASPTAYGYSKIGEHRLRQGTHSTNQSRMAEHQILAGFDRCAERTNEFTFGHTGHMDIILGRGASDTGSGGGHGSKAGAGAGGLFENIKEKAKSVTKRNFLN